MTVRGIIAGAWKSCARKGRWHWIRFALLLAVSWFAGQALKDSPYLTDLRYWVYRHQLELSNRGPVYPRRTALVVLDDADYWGVDFAGRSPLKRGELASILDRLREAGANTVVLDVDLRAPHLTEPAFEFPDYQKEDSELLAAVGRMCDAGRSVVLGTSVLLEGDDYVEAPSLFTPQQASYPCLSAGYLQLPSDLRLVPGQLDLRGGGSLDSLALKVVSLINPTAYKLATSNADRGFRFARYLSEADYRPADGPKYAFNWLQLKNADIKDVRRDIADKVVLIGGKWHANAQGQGPTVDTFHSPVGPLPGVFLHANYIEALDGERGTFAPMSDTAAEVIEFLLAIALALVAALEIHSGWKWTALFTSLLLSVILTYILLENLGIFLDFMVPVLILIGHTLIEEVMDMRTKLHHLKLHHERVNS
jgi:CHASE2 domain-containing sensor protein